MGSCEVYPQTLSHNPNGRFVVVCGDGEYIIYTAMALRNKSFGTGKSHFSTQNMLSFITRWQSVSANFVLPYFFKLFIFNWKSTSTFSPDSIGPGKKMEVDFDFKMNS